jgi:hypothetical protein
VDDDRIMISTEASYIAHIKTGSQIIIPLASPESKGCSFKPEIREKLTG